MPHLTLTTVNIYIYSYSTYTHVTYICIVEYNGEVVDHKGC